MSMRENDRNFDRRESTFELKDILRDIDRLLNDSSILTDSESSHVLAARDSLFTVLESIEKGI